MVNGVGEILDWQHSFLLPKESIFVTVAACGAQASCKLPCPGSNTYANLKGTLNLNQMACEILVGDVCSPFSH